MPLPTDEPANLFVMPFISSSSSIRPPGGPSKTPWISDIVLSKLLLLLLGLVIVVPKLACLACPLLGEGVDIGDCELEEREDIPEVFMRDRGALDVSFSRLSATPFGVTGGAWMAPSLGVLGSEEDPDTNMALASSESASKRSGGRRSFSISDFRLYEGNFNSQDKSTIKVY